MDIDSLAHSKWNCKYHIVFAPKYRRQVIYGKIKADIGRILRLLCERKGVDVKEIRKEALKNVSWWEMSYCKDQRCLYRITDMAKYYI